MVKGIPSSWLAALPESLKQSISGFELVHQGRADTCFLATSSGLELFAKQANIQTLATERAALELLAEHTAITAFLTPKLHAVTNSLLLTNKVQGNSILPSLDSLVSSGDIALALAQLHQLDVLDFGVDTAEFSLPTPANFELFLTKAGVEAQLIDQLLLRLDKELATIARIPAQLGFIHGDLTLDNWLITAEGKLVILDWEFASLRDVRWDLATICQELPLSSTQISEFVKSYQAQIPQPVADFELGLSAWRFIYSTVCFIWAVQEQHKVERYLTQLKQA